MPSEILNLGFQSLPIIRPIAENLLITGNPSCGNHMAWESPKIHPKLFWGGSNTLSRTTRTEMANYGSKPWYTLHSPSFDGYSKNVPHQSSQYGQ